MAREVSAQLVNDMETKICKRCQKEKPASDFGLNNNSPDGLQTWCRECTNLYSTLRHAHKLTGGVKYCRVCHQILPRDQFIKTADNKDGLTTFCAKCAETHHGGILLLDSEDNASEVEQEVIFEDVPSVIKSKAQRFTETTEMMSDLYIRKNADYGDSFTDSINEFGYTAALLRMGDKFNRIKHLLLSETPVFVNEEKITDTLVDLANYAIMLKIEIESRNE